ncbi:MAG: hypothetical protein ACK50N_01765 [Flavobacteriales bacterium]|jgi:hypothetical protein
MLEQLNRLDFIKFLFSLCIIGGISLMLIACEKEEPQEPKLPCTLADEPEDVIRRFYFNEGSYFIYQEMNSGAIDTLTVFEAYKGQNEVQHYFVVKYQSSFTGNQWFYSYGSSFSCDDCFYGCQLHGIDRSFYDPVGNDYRAADGFAEPNRVGSTGTNVNSIYYVEEKLPELRLFDNTYTNVDVWYHTNCNSEDAWEDTRFYWGEPAGLLRKTNIVTNKDWVLKEYFINQ